MGPKWVSGPINNHGHITIERTIFIFLWLRLNGKISIPHTLKVCTYPNREQKNLGLVTKILKIGPKLTEIWTFYALNLGQILRYGVPLHFWPFLHWVKLKYISSNNSFQPFCAILRGFTLVLSVVFSAASSSSQNGVQTQKIHTCYENAHKMIHYQKVGQIWPNNICRRLVLCYEMGNTPTCDKNIASGYLEEMLSHSALPKGALKIYGNLCRVRTPPCHSYILMQV